jgi:class 3 adenylate cyclase
MQQLDADTSRIERLFKLPSIVVFAGHMIDRPDREVPRFPPQLEPAVGRAIRQRLEELGAGFGFASAACGADILFHEAILDMKGESHVVLPFREDLFIKESVGFISGTNWIERYERVVARAVEVHEASRQSRTGDSILYEFANLMLLGLASVRAQQLDTELVRLVVWDGKPGDGAGGTASVVERWQALGPRVNIINLSEIRLECLHLASPSAIGRGESGRRTNEVTAGFTPEIRALLFADAKGFSKLNDAEIPRFVDHFLGLVATLAKESVYRPLMKNTWGDGLYLVFANVRDAGQFALELCDSVRNTDWSAKGLPNINLRIGLHAGPVYACMDPVIERVSYVGPHVSRAARIEPITPAGLVYASQEFAALAAAEGVKEIRCDYVGQTAMAKKYGTFGTYVVRRRHKA